MSTQPVANAWRDSGVAAASEKPWDQVQPPTDSTVFRWGWSAFSWAIWLNEPRKVPTSQLSPG